MKHVFIFAVSALLLTVTNVVAINGNDARLSRTTTTETGTSHSTSQVNSQQPEGNDAQLYTPAGNADKQYQQKEQSVNNQQTPEESETIAPTNDNDTLNEGLKNTVSKNESGSYEENNQIGTGDNSSSGFLTWLIAGLAILCVIFWYFRHSRNRYTKQQKNQNDERTEGQGKTANVAILHRELGDLSHRLISLEGKVQQLNDLISKIKDNQPQPQTSIQSFNTAFTNSSKQPIMPKQLYANILNGNLFPESVIQKNKDEYTVFVLSVLGNDGTFIVNDAPEAQANLISSFAYIVANAVDVNAKASNAQRIVTLQPGKVQKAEGGWRIVENAIVELS